MLPQPAYVLFRKPWRESDLLLEAFTREAGRLGMIARGVRTARSRWRTRLEPFVPLDLAWVQKGELAQLRSAEEHRPEQPMPVPRLVLGWYLNELVLRLTVRHDPQPDLFALYAEALQELAACPVPEMALRVFEKRLLDVLGYGLRLTHTDTGVPVRPGGHYQVVHGGAVEAEGRDEAGIVGETLLALAAGTLEDRHLPGAKRITRAALAELLQGRPLRTREWLRAQRGGAAT